MQKIDLKDLSFQEMERFISSLGEKPYRAKQVFEWVFQKDADDIGGMTNLSKNLRNRLSELSYISRLSIADKRISEDGTSKYLFILPPLLPPLSPSFDKLRTGSYKRGEKEGVTKGDSIESVLIPDVPSPTLTPTIFQMERERETRGEEVNKRLTLCISTQVGCKLNCAFCLTGKGGFIRNLRHSEIIEQILSIRRDIQKSLIRQDIQDKIYLKTNPVNPVKEKITNIVLMGMGEPLDNYETVVKAVKTFVSPHGLKIPATRITLSTSGLIPEIERLAKENLKINLAVSLNASNNETRDKIMPVNKKYPIEDLLKVLRKYPLPTGRRITFEYVMIKDINDSIEDADRLSRLLKDIRCKINLIPFNTFEGSGLKAPDSKRVEDFQNLLISRHYTAIIRKSKGTDICAACGQLRGSKMTIED